MQNIEHKTMMPHQKAIDLANHLNADAEQDSDELWHYEVRNAGQYAYVVCFENGNYLGPL